MSKLRTPSMEEMLRAILAMKNENELYSFLEDLCTISELKAMEQRYQVAKLLAEGMVYNNIASETGASSATISRVGRALHYGADGYMLALERTKK